jgi:hypothetical protein
VAAGPWQASGAEQVQSVDGVVDEQQAMPAGLRRDAEQGTAAAAD